jgi:hypothetical protein
MAKGNGSMTEGGADCEPHTPCPKGYLARAEWFEKMAETDIQRRCCGCGLWAVWEPKIPR